MKMDINCDMGEIPEMVEDGSQEALMPYLTSVNIACGGHAGNEQIMGITVRQALRWNLQIGAHPGYPDRANFGRLPMEMSADDIATFVYEQIEVLAGVARRQGASVRHVKPHGALYNSAVANEKISQAIAQGVARWSKDVMLLGLAGSTMLDVFGAAGFKVRAEAFADRRYEPDGSLRSRTHSDSLITDPALAASQAHDIAERGIVTAVNGQRIRIQAQTLCIHGDTPGAVEIAKAVASGMASV